jgi:hypothetical protein
MPGKTARPGQYDLHAERYFDLCRFDVGLAGAAATPVFSRNSSFFIRGLGLGQIFLDYPASFAGECVEIGVLRAGHRLVTGGPLSRILDRAVVDVRVLLDTHHETSLFCSNPRTRPPPLQGGASGGFSEQKYRKMRAGDRPHEVSEYLFSVASSSFPSHFLVRSGFLALETPDRFLIEVHGCASRKVDTFLFQVLVCSSTTSFTSREKCPRRR